MKRSVLFLQLPRLDHDAHGRRENVPLAAVYLRNALENSAEAAFHRVVSIPRQDELDDQHLLASIQRVKPDIIAATLYLWNVERTLDLLDKAREILPKMKVIVGGPEVAADHPFLPGWGFAETEPVIHLVNDYDRDLFNGSLGRIRRILPALAEKGPARQAESSFR